MIVTGTWRGRPVTLSIKPNCLTVSLDDPAQAEVYSYDLEGRLWTAFMNGRAYRRGLDGKIIVRWRDPGAARERRWLDLEQALAVEARVRQAVAGLYAALESGAAQLNGPLPPEARQALCDAIAFDRARSQADAAHYHQVYKPIGILPPDQYMAVVLQATEGCSFNTCTFCSFYRDRPFRIKTPDEFRQHAQDVRAFLGRGLSLRRTIFLGDANAIVVPTERLLRLLDVVHEVYDVERLGGIYAFLDGFSGEKKSAVDYARLRARGLRRVYIGLESGSPGLLRLLRKPGLPADAVAAVRALKTAGVAVGVIVLLGAGGQRWAAEHVRESTAVLNAMQLDLDDIVYFSELFPAPDAPYTQDAIQAGLQPLTPEEIAAQQAAIEAGLVFTAARGTPHISRYDIREFIY